MTIAEVLLRIINGGGFETVSECEAAVAAIQTVRDDAARLDYLLSLIQRSHVSEFPRTREQIDAQMGATK